MYMPLCRICHARETNYNLANVYEGDPAQIDVNIENEAQKNKAKLVTKTFSAEESTLIDETTLLSDSSALKSFLSDIDGSPTEDGQNDHFKLRTSTPESDTPISV